MLFINLTVSHFWQVRSLTLIPLWQLLLCLYVISNYVKWLKFDWQLYTVWLTALYKTVSSGHLPLDILLIGTPVNLQQIIFSKLTGIPTKIKCCDTVFVKRITRRQPCFHWNARINGVTGVEKYLLISYSKKKNTLMMSHSMWYH